MQRVQAAGRRPCLLWKENIGQLAFSWDLPGHPSPEIQSVLTRRSVWCLVYLFSPKVYAPSSLIFLLTLTYIVIRLHILYNTLLHMLHSDVFTSSTSHIIYVLVKIWPPVLQRPNVTDCPLSTGSRHSQTWILLNLPVMKQVITGMLLLPFVPGLMEL